MVLNQEIKKEIFREYDIRGNVAKGELTPAIIERIAFAYGYFLQENQITRAVLGYDNRPCSEDFAAAAAAGLSAAGIAVFQIGLTTTPAVYFSQYLLRCPGAMMITASHNPSDWSGLKLAKGYSATLEPNDVQRLYELLNISGGASLAPGIVKEANTREAYLGEIVKRVGVQRGHKEPLRVVIDCGNGGTGLFAWELFEMLGYRVFQLNCDPDMDYPHYFPNPSLAEARKRLREMVIHPYIKADIGLSFDGDGDRLGVIDGNGNDVWSDKVLMVLAKEVLEKYRGGKIVFDVKCTNALPEYIAQLGGKPIMWKTGHSYIKAKLHAEKAVLAGERSGHIFYGKEEYFGFDDALFAGVKLLSILQKEGKSITELLGAMPQYVTSPEIKVHCSDTEKYGVMEKITEELQNRFGGDAVCTINGARVSMERGWGLVRASSNLPELVLIFEGKTREDMDNIKDIFREVLSHYSQIDSVWENE
ncbi:MAG: phosphomannomutase/phosphoglucomutase [Peptococcaceae bacterium]|nr:phosphomannomutase/phosphoglucomutase [Peptococcaceae bacterium]